MTFLNGKGVLKIGHTPKEKKDADVIIVRSFVADECEVLGNPSWRSVKMADFLNAVGDQLSEMKGDTWMDYPVEVLEPIIKPFDNKNSLDQQVVVTFTARLPGRKETH